MRAVRGVERRWLEESREERSWRSKELMRVEGVGWGSDGWRGEGVRWMARGEGQMDGERRGSDGWREEGIG